MPLADRIARRVDFVRARCRERLPEVAEVYADELRSVLGKQGSSEDRSKPGEAPRRQTGQLQDSVTVEAYPQSGVAYVGPLAFYGPILEPTRPYYDIANNNCRQKMRDMMFEDLGSGGKATGGGGKKSLGQRIKSFFRRGR